jgi:hypothetical protein
MAEASWKEKLRGAVDLLFLFGLKGIAPFEKSTPAQSLRSVMIPIALFPVGLLCAWLYPPDGLDKAPTSTILAIEGCSDVLVFLATTALVWVFAKAFSTRERFWVAFQASNWTGIPMLLLTLPFLYLGIANIYPREQMMKVLSIVGAYGYLFVEACVLFRGLKISWEFAGLLVCLEYVIGTQIWHLMFFLNGVPIVWE